MEAAHNRPNRGTFLKKIRSGGDMPSGERARSAQPALIPNPAAHVGQDGILRRIANPPSSRATVRHDT